MPLAFWHCWWQVPSSSLQWGLWVGIVSGLEVTPIFFRGKGKLDYNVLPIVGPRLHELIIIRDKIIFQVLTLYLSSCWNLNFGEDRIYVYILGLMWMGGEAGPCFWTLYLILQLYKAFTLDSLLQEGRKEEGRARVMGCRAGFCVKSWFLNGLCSRNRVVPLPVVLDLGLCVCQASECSALEAGRTGRRF